jgi:hypothetical protein
MTRIMTDRDRFPYQATPLDRLHAARLQKFAGDRGYSEGIAAKPSFRYHYGRLMDHPASIPEGSFGNGVTEIEA